MFRIQKCSSYFIENENVREMDFLKIYFTRVCMFYKNACPAIVINLVHVSHVPFHSLKPDSLPVNTTQTPEQRKMMKRFSRAKYSHFLI